MTLVKKAIFACWFRNVIKYLGMDLCDMGSMGPAWYEGLFLRLKRGVLLDISINKLIIISENGSSILDN